MFKFDFSPRCVFFTLEDNSGMVRHMISIGQPSCVMCMCLTFFHCMCVFTSEDYGRMVWQMKSIGQPSLTNSWLLASEDYGRMVRKMKSIGQPSRSRFDQLETEIAQVGVDV